MSESGNQGPAASHRPGGGWRAAWAAGRAAPFVMFAVAGIWRAGQAPAGRHPPQFDWTVSGAAAGRALTKFPHLKWAVVLFVLAVVAVGAARALLAGAMALATTVGWELAETTVVGHHASLIDLLPDLVGIVLAFLVFSVVRKGVIVLAAAREGSDTGGRSPS
jgi:hypothetical protein